MGKKLLFLAALGVTALSGAQADAQNLTGRAVADKPAKSLMISKAQSKTPVAQVMRSNLPTDYGTPVEVINEDFSLMTAGTYGQPDSTVTITSDTISKYPFWINMLPEYTHQAGWGGHYLSPAGGCVATSYSDGGNLNTPMLDCSGNQGVVFLEFKARTDVGVAGQYLLVEAAETFNMQPSWNTLGTVVLTDLSSDWKTYTVKFYNAGQYTLFNIVRQQMVQDDVVRRIYLDDVRVYTIDPFIAMPTALPYTDYDGESFMAHWTKVDGAVSYRLNVYSKDVTGDYGNEQTTINYVLQDFAVEDTAYTVENVESGKTYYYTVQAVNSDGKVSFECPEAEVYDLVAPSLEDANVGADSTYTAKWDAVPSAEVYNYWASYQRMATSTGKFNVTNESLDNLEMTDGSEITWSFDEPSYYSYDNYVIKPFQTQAGWIAKQGLPYPGCVCVDGWQYMFSHADAGLVSPELDLSKDGGKVNVQVDLRGDHGEVWFADNTHETRYTRAAFALFNWNEQKGDFEQAELIYDNDLPEDEFKTSTVTFTKGTSRSKIGIYAVYAPAHLYLKNLVVSQDYKAGETFLDPFYYGRYLEGTETTVKVPQYAVTSPISHKVSAVKTNPRTREQKESAFSKVKQVGNVYNGIGSVSLSNAPVQVVNGKLTVTGNEVVNVYSLNGTLVYSGKAEGNTLTVPVQSGSYIVKIGKQSIKVVF